MIDANKIYEEIQTETKGKSGLERHIVLMKFMCRCFELVEKEYSIPAVAKKAIDIAKAHWIDGNANKDEMDAVRVECWDFLDRKEPKNRPLDREDMVLRALISVTFPEPFSDDFAKDSFEWFFAMMNNLGDFSKKVDDLR